MKKYGPKKIMDIPAIDWKDTEGNFYIMKDSQLGVNYRMRKKK